MVHEGIVMASPMATAPVRAWIHGFWTFYRRYTDTAVHTAATAGLAIFGLLVFVDPWFAAVAIACYAVPPLVLYVRADGSARETEPERDRSSEAVSPRSQSDADVGNGDTSSDSDDGDTDAGFDTAGTDTDSDSDDGDTDSDTDG